MKQFTLFLGCTIPARLSQYESAARAVLDRLDVRAIDIKAFNCCGYPLRNIDFKAFVQLSARNLALAERQGHDIMTLCQCCFGSLKAADHLLKKEESLRKDVNAVLGREGLHYEGGVEIRHLLQVLFHDVGIKAIKKQIRRGFAGLKIAAHYGCHALRPSAIVQFDDPVSPTLFDELIGVTGAESVSWQRRLECCGAPLRGVNDELSIALTKKKLEDAHGTGAAYLCVACPYCQLQFETVQGGEVAKDRQKHRLPTLLYPQLLGLCLGIDHKVLGLEANQVPITGIESFFSRVGMERRDGPQQGSHRSRGVV